MGLGGHRAGAGPRERGREGSQVRGSQGEGSPGRRDPKDEVPGEGSQGEGGPREALVVSGSLSGEGLHGLGFDRVL